MAPSHTVISRDGTSIAYDREGEGPPVILIGGAFQFRAFDPATKQLAKLLAARGYSVINYDRRGRGESGHEATMTLADNIADLWAIVTELERMGDAPTGVALFGNSSGGSIALAAAAAGLPVNALVMFEVPLGVEQGTDGAEFLAGLRDRIAGDDPDAVVEYYMKDMPAEWLEQAKTSPSWPLMVRIGPSLEADAESLAWAQSAPHAELLGRIQAPTLVLVGEETLDVMTRSADAMVAAMPAAEQRAIPAAQHQWQPEVMAATIAEFLDERVER
ncbi:alpha/beta fold hydrolase [Agromyces aurantiacus]|uniref:Alpha/beta fold hydrolase n=1 Tax=Agromyces aurantiacus TaxID=165814 RepID=A0ABV9R3V9_9MICO|nr:alpha/beta hydrolase [Agromyces aurantiacus]MBM7503506.1 pimeloyl-ACP methyl ester carboxylesterase [Agromyces aurantiacus]